MRSRIKILRRCVFLICLLLAALSGSWLWYDWPSESERALGFRLPKQSKILCVGDGGYDPSIFRQWVIESPTGQEQLLRRQLLEKSKEVYLPESIQTIRQIIKSNCVGKNIVLHNSKYCFTYKYKLDSNREIDVSLLIDDQFETMVVSRQKSR